MFRSPEFEEGSQPPFIFAIGKLSIYIYGIFFYYYIKRLKNEGQVLKKVFSLFINVLLQNMLLNFAIDQGILRAGKENMIMPNIKPISDLRNYSDVLRDVSVGEPVFLTKNGRGRYAIIDMQDYEKGRATLKLMNELSKGKKSGEEKGWLSSSEVRAHFRAKANEE